jgi:hypothetical protein
MPDGCGIKIFGNLGLPGDLGLSGYGFITFGHYENGMKSGAFRAIGWNGFVQEEKNPGWVESKEVGTHSITMPDGRK